MYIVFYIFIYHTNTVQFMYILYTYVKHFVDQTDEYTQMDK